MNLRTILLAMCIGIQIPCGAQTVVKADTMYLIRLKDVDVIGERKWANDLDRYHYNQTRYYVTTILPYLDAATKMFNEINAKLADPKLGRKERKEYIASREEDMRTQFEDKIAALNVTQGGLLTKLIARQTGVNVYQMALEMRNPFKAIKWQTWARVNGLNLNEKYDPAKEPDLEHIMTGLGYPLPAFYDHSADNAIVSGK